MRFRLTPQSKYADSVQDIKINLSTFNKYKKYIANHPEKKFFIIINSSNDDINDVINFFKDLKILNRLFILLSSRDYSAIEKLKKDYIPFGIDYPVSSAQEALELVSLGAEEICVDGALGFNENFCHKLQTEGISIRIAPQYGKLTGTDSIFDGVYNFFIPPKFLDQFYGFSIVDFAEPDQMKEDTLYKIYAIDKEWAGNLKLLISGLNTDAYENTLAFKNTTFYELRKNCKQRCLQDYGSPNMCHACYNMFQLSALVNDKLL